MNKRLLALAAAVAALCTSAVAQTVPPPSIARTATYVLPQTPVQTELKVTSDQSKKIRGVIEEWGKAQNAIYATLGPEATNEQAEAAEKKADALAEEYGQKLAAILDATQNSRLRQIVLQHLGTEAFRIPSVAKELGLSKEQAGKIDAIDAKFMKEAEDFWAVVGARVDKIPQPNPNDASAIKKYQEEIRKIEKSLEAETKALNASQEKAKASALAVLTPEQKSIWAKMTGPKFTIKAPAG